jgi:hypothetical protein
MTSHRIVWSPQPGPQKALIDCPLTEIFFGGARGGGKTDGILGKFGIKAELYGNAFNGVFFRKEMPQQDDLVERGKEIYVPLGATWHEQKKMFVFARGGRIRFRPLENLADAEKYQGQNLTDAAVEEVGNYESSGPIDRLFGALRSAAGVPVQLILSGNPGGPGHVWIKTRYIDPAPLGMKILSRRLPNGEDHRFVYIPSKVQQNRELLHRDPGYINRLYLVGSDTLVKAWLEGDWNVVEGAFFDCWSTARHVVKPFAIPAHWTRIRSMDWGSARPFSVGWWAVASEDTSALNALGESMVIPRGCMVYYRAWYGASGPNVGLKMTAEEVGRGIVSRETEAMNDAVIDPSTFSEDGGPSIRERIYQGSGQKILFRRADNARVPRLGHIGGWDQVRARMKGDVDGRPMMVVFSTCTDFIRTVPVLQHDRSNPEDVDSDGEDHCFSKGTLVNTGNGVCSFEQLLGTSWQVYSSDGKLHAYRNVRLVKRAAKIVSLLFSDGSEVKCTPEHKFLTISGWTEARHLSGLSLQPAKNSEASDITFAASIFRGMVAGCIARCGGILTGLFRRAFTSTTKTKCGRITPQRTYSALAPASIRMSISRQSEQNNHGRLSLVSGIVQQLGTVAKKAANGIANIIKNISGIGRSLLSLSSAYSARWSSWAIPDTGFAPMPVGLPFAGSPESITSSGNVSFVAAGSEPTNTQKSERAHRPAKGFSADARELVCLSVSDAGIDDVYCLTVPETGNFVLANGAIVANCADQMRYAFMTRPYISTAPSTEPIRGTAEMTMAEAWAKARPKVRGIDSRI